MTQDDPNGLHPSHEADYSAAVVLAGNKPVSAPVTADDPITDSSSPDLDPRYVLQCFKSKREYLAKFQRLGPEYWQEPENITLAACMDHLEECNAMMGNLADQLIGRRSRMVPEWQPMSSYPLDHDNGADTDWGPTAVLRVNGLPYVGHLEADMWLYNTEDSPESWSEFTAIPDGWIPLPEPVKGTV